MRRIGLLLAVALIAQAGEEITRDDDGSVVCRLRFPLSYYETKT